MNMDLENIARKAAEPVVILGGVVYILLNILGCIGNATPTPNPTQNPSPRPSPTQTYKPTPGITLTPYPIETPEPTIPSPAYTPTPKPTPTPQATATPDPTATPVINNSYDFGKSLGLNADYLKNVKFDDNAKSLITYLSAMPLQMRAIAERSGLLEDILADKKIDAKESSFFNKVIDSYKKEIETMKPWLNQLPENEVTASLALNLRNFMGAGYLKNEKMPSLLSPAIFFADGIQRMYAAEINDPVGWRSSPKKVYTSTMVDNITNFLEIQKKALEVANDPKYDIFIGDDARKHFKIEAVGSTDAGLNAYEDISLLVREGSPEAKAALRIYGRNFVEGNKGSAPQVRVEMTEIYLWSLGIPSYKVILAGHDVPTIPLTLDDIALLKSRSADQLFILEIDGRYHLPFQWTRKSIVKKEWEEFSLYNGTGAIKLKVSELKSY